MRHLGRQSHQAAKKWIDAAVDDVRCLEHAFVEGKATDLIEVVVDCKFAHFCDNLVVTTHEMDRTPAIEIMR